MDEHAIDLMAKEMPVANEEQLKLLRQGVEAWNQWCFKNLYEEIKIDLSGANLCEMYLYRAILVCANLSGGQFDGANLSKANLLEADFTGAVLYGTDITNADVRNATFCHATFWQANLSGSNLTNTDLSKADGSEVNFSKAVLWQANLTESDFSGANFTDANLFRIQAFDTDFTGANFTGACIEDWSINRETKLDDVKCDYVYLKCGEQERRPSDPSRIFEPGEFKALVQKALSTVDLIFRNGVDWQALLISLEKLRVETSGAESSIQAIENKGDGAFVVRVNTPLEADKAEVEKFLKREYEVALKLLDEKYRVQLQAKEREIEVYRQQNTDLMEIVRLMANRPVNVQGDYVEGNKAANDLVLGDKIGRDKNISSDQ